MLPFATSWVFGVIGPVLLLLAIAQRYRHGTWTPRAKAWLHVGLDFCAVALWLFRNV